MVTDEMLKRAIEAYRKDTGAEDWQILGWVESAIRAALEAALSAAEPEKPEAEEYRQPEWIWYCESTKGPMVTLGRWAKNPQQKRYKLADIQPTEHDHPAPSVAVKAGEAAEKLQRALDAASPNHKTMWVYVDDLRSALSAQVQDESEIIECLLSGKPFVFDPATNFCHADDGGAPEHGIKYVPSAQVQDVAGWQLVPKQPTEEMLDAYWGQTGESEAMRSRVHARAKIHYHVMLAAAPAKQEGGTNE